MPLKNTLGNQKVSCVTAIAVQLLLTGGTAWTVWQFAPREPAAPASPPTATPGPAWNAAAEDATWPWKGAKSVQLRRGVTHWQKTSKDGTVLELVRFDFIANPFLRFEMYDQDQDAPQPWTNKIQFANLGVVQAVKHLNEKGRGKVIAATNGMFFHATGYTEKDYASHVSPVVVDGKPHYADGENVRWTFGVKNINGQPQFDADHTPDKRSLSTRFDFAAGGAQVLIWDGVVAASPAEHVGYDSSFEAMRTSRVAFGWTQDSRHLYLLFVKEPDSELASKIAAKQHTHLGGGWMFSDMRRFFGKLGVWRAFNSDAGDVAQMLLLRADGRYDFVPPRTSERGMRLILPAAASGSPDVSSAPRHGSLMYWYVREVP